MGQGEPLHKRRFPPLGEIYSLQTRTIVFSEVFREAEQPSNRWVITCRYNGNGSTALSQMSVPTISAVGLFLEYNWVRGANISHFMC